MLMCIEKLISIRRVKVMCTDLLALIFILQNQIHFVSHRNAIAETRKPKLNRHLKR